MIRDDNELNNTFVATNVQVWHVEHLLTHEAIEHPNFFLFFHLKWKELGGGGYKRLPRDTAHLPHPQHPTPSTSSKK